MAVVSLKGTGHVLAAVAAREGAPALTLEALVGAGFPLRPPRRTGANVPAVRFLLPASVLELKQTALDLRALAQPLDYAVDGGSVVMLPAAVPPVPTLTTQTVSLAGVVGTPAGFIAVRGIMPDYTEQRLQSGTTDAATQRLSLNLMKEPGTSAEPGTPAGLDLGRTCAVAVALAGFRLACTERNVQ